MTTAQPVRIRTSARPVEFVAFVAVVDESGHEVRVRFRRSNHGGLQWRCDQCGRHRFSTCPHELAAAHAWRARHDDLSIKEDR
ncbi:hypothetical protein GCM10009809_08230 [Isoptericola hypogeus]|uniref:SWIM-type domain-containing protein n=1 Tax=Isoptericola hypogeus TaxID=300179 RepID=A0ABP4V1F9_9MICO